VSHLKKNLRASLIDSGAYSLMVGIGETYFAAFALALGFGEVTAGLLATAPLLAGATLQLVSPWAVQVMRSHRRWVITCAVVQAFSFVPFVVGALSGRFGPWAMFAFAALYWAGGQGAGPAWNTWVEALVPRRLRPGFFAKRNRLAHAMVLLGLLAGGLALQLGAEHGRVLLTFAMLFAVAAAARMVSARYLGAQSETPNSTARQESVRWRGLGRRLWRAEDGRLVLYMLAVQVSVHISAAYFTPFMLKELHLSYALYMVLLTASLVARVVALPLLGAATKRLGARWLLWVGGLGIIPMSAAWTLSDNYAYLLIAQAVAGVAWAAYELAVQLLFFEMIRRDERTSVLTLFNFAQAAAIVIGASIGGLVLHGLGNGTAAYYTLFIGSMVARAFSVLLLLRVARLPRQLVELAQRIIAVRPSAGAMSSPVLPSVVEPTVASANEAKARHDDDRPARTG
jgi:MFS family permease